MELLPLYTFRNMIQKMFTTNTQLWTKLFLHTCTPGYFAPFLKPRSSAFKTHSSTANNIILDIPQYIPLLHKSTKHFSASFNFDAPKIWNDLPADIHSTPSLMSFRSRLKVYIFFSKDLSSLTISISRLFSVLQTQPFY